MYIFLGDFVIQDIGKFTKNPFVKFKEYLKDNKIIVNLESPFIEPKKMEQVKNKITLFHLPEDITYLKQLNPFLVSLSNNHINDYGNQSVLLTESILTESKINFVGVGFLRDKKHINVIEEDKSIFMAYTTRETDLTDNILFATETFMGPKDIDFEEIKYYRDKFHDYKIILILHWGVEHIPIPLYSQRELAYRLIDAGVDLIIGNHAHVIQPYEIHNNKYIFYSLGNFLFPDIEYTINNKKYKLKHSKPNKKGLMCSFDIDRNELIEANIIFRDKQSELALAGKYKKELKLKNGLRYKFLYYLYKKKYEISNKLDRALDKFRGIFKRNSI